MTFADLYPNLSPDELKEAEHNFTRYLEIAFQIANETAQKQAIEDREAQA